MSVSYHISGFRVADEKWQKMKAVWEACYNACVPIPKAVDEFFGGNKPDEALGVQVNIDSAVQDCGDHYDVDLEKLPSDVKVLRFSIDY